MKIKIGDNNKIKNSSIGEQTNINFESKNDSFFSRHPVITSLLTSFFIGFILLFSFWDNLILFIEGIFK